MATTTTTIFLMSDATLPLSPIIPHTPPQSVAEAEAEAEAETEVYRRQAYAIRGLVYPGPRRVLHNKRPSLAKSSSTPNAKRPKSLGGCGASSGGGAGQTVSAGKFTFFPFILMAVTTTPPTPRYLFCITMINNTNTSSFFFFPAPKPSPAPAEESFATKEPSFARLIEDLLRTHSSTASPYGQHLSHSILNDSNKVYLGNFYGGLGPGY